MEKQYLTIKQTAYMLQISRFTVYNMIKKGILHPTKIIIGKHPIYRLDPDEISKLQGEV